MKGIFRSPAVQTLIGALLAAYGALITATLRWRVVDLTAVEAALASPRGALALFWHGRIGAAIACRPLLRGRRARVMISLSRDGAFIARTAEALGIPVIRGSTGREGHAGDKGGAAALRAAVGAIGEGDIMLITPDGPRGPAQTMTVGPLQLARVTKAEAFALGLAVSPALRLESWDRAHIPLPFSRAALVVAGPLAAPLRATADEIETLRQAWQSALLAAQAEAEVRLAAAR
ncbi:MAG TPA: DUF374 domain-containing protein [Caulobacteraceae bacterium]|jgi:hypothetical protein|nr:DUF374 domain-containing protein [Caulobacteraceae bacterium]